MTGDSRLGERARQLIVSTPKIFLSIASLWEVGIKSGLGKLDIDVLLERLVEEFPLLRGLDLLPVEPRHVRRLAALPHHHHDPLGMIIAQALTEGLPVVGSDAAFDAYGVRRII